MTMLGTGFDPGRDARRSLKASVRHQHEAAVWGLGRIRWTAGNILRLVALVAVVAAALTGVTMWGISAGREEAASRSVVQHYFDAVERSDERAMKELSCSRDNSFAEELGLPDPWGFDEFTSALRATSGTEMRVSIDPHWGHAEVRYHDFEIQGRVRGTVKLAPSEGTRPWRVCGFLDLQVRDAN
jgi:hypothetical protein